MESLGLITSKPEIYTQPRSGKLNAKKYLHVKSPDVCRGRLLAVIFTTATLSGCQAIPRKSRININDNRVILSETKVAFNFDNEKSHPRPIPGTRSKSASLKPEARPPTHASSQQPVVLHGTTLTTPQQLRYDYDYEYGDIAWRWRKFFGEGLLGLEVTAVPAFTKVDLKISSAT